MDAAIYSLSLAAITFFAFLALKGLDRRLAFAFGALCALYIGLDDLVTGLGSSVAALDLVGGEWNWSGKLYSLLLSAAVIAGLGVSARAAALSWPQRNVRMGLLLLVPLTLFGVLLGLIFQPPTPSGETLAFQALMPSLAEELAYRGIAPALLLGLIRGREVPSGIPWIVIFIAAVPFSVVHGLGFLEGSYSFDMVPALYTFSGGLVYGWLRFSTGSLLFPILAHSCANVAFHLTAFG
jgi:hypothetical protein